MAEAEVIRSDKQILDDLIATLHELADERNEVSARLTQLQDELAGEVERLRERAAADRDLAARCKSAPVGQTYLRDGAREDKRADRLQEILDRSKGESE